jgi:uncharacterized flavoprotein (TIGR03862 family)
MSSLSRGDAADVVVVGGGPAGLMAAEVAAAGGASVLVIDHMRGVGRKFLLAGRSGLNLSHRDVAATTDRYIGSAAAQVRESVGTWGTDGVVTWCTSLGVETFVGSSGRIFPVGMRAAPLLRAWLTRLTRSRVRFMTSHRLVAVGTGWIDVASVGPESAAEPTRVRAASIVLATGGASWPRVGSTGTWPELLRPSGVEVAPWEPANSGAHVEWSERLLEQFEGSAVKNCALTVRAGTTRTDTTRTDTTRTHTVRGDVVITRRGLEGTPVYALGPELRAGPSTTLMVNLRPDMRADELARRIAKVDPKRGFRRQLSTGANLSDSAIALINEAIGRQWAKRPMTSEHIAGLIANVPVPVAGVAGLDRAISSAGGILGAELDPTSMLRRMPGVWAIGEMQDWEAPTGGYLIHGCLAQGRVAGAAAVGAAAAGAAPVGGR